MTGNHCKTLLSERINYIQQQRPNNYESDNDSSNIQQQSSDNYKTTYGVRANMGVRGLPLDHRGATG